MSDWKEQISGAIDRMEERLRDVGKDIFEHPEVKFEEVHAARRLAGELEEAGFEVELGVAGMETAIRAVHPVVSDGPTVAILGEYDALPEIDHACGHNLIAAGGLGAALAVGSIKSELPGKLLFLGTPAEEGGGGKVLMIDAGLFEGVDAALMFHPSTNTTIGRGSLAITEVKIEFHGKPFMRRGVRRRGSTRSGSTSRTALGSTASSLTAASSRTSFPSTPRRSSTSARPRTPIATSCSRSCGSARRGRRSRPERGSSSVSSATRTRR